MKMVDSMFLNGLLGTIFLNGLFAEMGSGKMDK